MKRNLTNSSTIRRHLHNLALAVCLTSPLPAISATVALTTEPLATSTTSSVKPNVMFILDDSGSMAGDFLPDWADDTDPTSGLYASSGQQYTKVPALHRNSSFNGVAYNPEVTYTPPVLYKADGSLDSTTYPNIGSPWTSVKDDAFRTSGSTNLITSFPDVEWCTSTAYTDCLRNDNLLLPGSITVSGVTKNYTVKHSKASTGSGNVATGSPDAPTTAARTFGPFYYTIVPGEYCDSANLKNCQANKTTAFSYPAPLRWCNSSSLCQAINNSTYKYPRYPTTFYTAAIPYSPAVPAHDAVPAIPGVAASASFTFNYSGSLSPVGFSIKVNGTEILIAASGYSPNALMTSAQLANWVSTWSSLTGYSITASGSTVTITATTVGTAKNISSVVISDATPSVTYTTSMTPGANASAGSAPSDGTLVMTAVARNKTISIKCGSTFIGQSGTWTSSTNSTASTRLNALYNSINNTTVNGYTMTCSKNPNTTAPTSITCAVSAPVGASACSGGFWVDTDITDSTNIGPSGGSNTVVAAQAVGTLTFTNTALLNPTGVSIKVNGTEIMSATTPNAATSSTGMATWVQANSSLPNYVITQSGSTVTFTAAATGTAWNINTITYTQDAPAPVTTTSPTYVAGVDAVAAQPATPYIPEVLAQPAGYYGKFIRTDIVPTNNSYPFPGTASKADTRTDCAGTTCTYDEEMTNFANWWTYYRTRMQAMKTSVSRSFKTLDDRFRVGFSTISDTGATDGTTFLGNNTFELGHKNTWFTTLFSQGTPGATPLRGALSKAGRYYADKISGETDPVQYSCQQNFVILSTDGYWNTNDETSTYKNLNLTGGTVGDMDGASPRPMYDSSAASGTLADVAKYYYDTDLRTSTLTNCTGGSSLDFPSGTDVCKNNVFTSTSDNNIQQHMTTFTMGLGADGTLVYTSDYQTATSGDYYDLFNGTGSPVVNWPNPITKTAGERIDDLWHAAVNGQGLYFSAKNPNEIITGFNNALSSITQKLGSAAAAATSTLNPVSGNNFAYVASYTTVKWFGNLEAREINTTNGKVSKTATWCVENVAEETCTSPGTRVPDTSGSSTIYNCVVTGTTAADCPSPGVFDSGTSTCKTEIQNSCIGKMASQVGAFSDARHIYTANVAGTALVAFDSTYATAHPTNFSAAHINGLNQWGTLNPTLQNTAEGVNLINYLRGQNGYEYRAANATQLYRVREAVLGDALESQPFYFKEPPFNYPYPGYAKYASDNSTRGGSVFMGTNDGMMHAFNTSDGTERWAYVPSMVIPNMWKLASTSYDISHTNYLNGSPNVADVCTASCDVAATAVWKTILVSGLSGGGRGYFALDVSNPDTPKLLWEFTPSTGAGVIKDDDLGYSFGQPVITRNNDGLWVVLVTSGYNNVSPGSGRGFLFVLNAETGAIISKIDTGVGDTTTPSGLAKIDGYNEEPGGNKIGFIYGGDLLGNLWRFDINSSVTAAIGKGDKLKFATLYADAGSSSPQPITTTPVLAKVRNLRQILISTGKYLEKSDLNTTQLQTMYSIQDNNETTTLINPRTTLVQQTLTNDTGTATRKSTKNPVDYTAKRGCYVDYPDVGERASIDSTLVQGVLIAPTIVPENSACSPGGYSWINYIDYENCGASPSNTTGLVGLKTDSTVVGVNIVYIDGKPIIEQVTSSERTPTIISNQPLYDNLSTAFRSKRVIWHELIP
ncbi:MAG: PilC/PilY family type IV pilus protein [Sideroxydans sp.]|nr:PilC/PilY family type IV pilus protein [Sideroxydans sp.]